MTSRRSLPVRRGGYVVSAAAAANLLALALPVALLQVYDRIIPDENLSTLAALVIGLAGAMVLEFLLRLSLGRIVASRRSVQEVELARCLHDRVLHEDLGEVERVSFAGYMDRLSALEEINSTRHADDNSIVVNMAFAAVFVGVILLIAPLVALVVSVTLLLTMIAIRRVAVSRQALANRREDVEARRTAYLIQLFSSIETIKSLGAMSVMERRYERLMAGNARLSASLAANASLVQSMSSSIAFATPILATGAGAVLVIAGELTVGGLAASILLSSRAAQQVMRFGEQIEGRDTAKRNMGAIAGSRSGQSAPPPHRPLSRVEHLEASDLRLTSSENRSAVFAGIDLELRRGEAIALLGAVGSGKTSLMNMLAGHSRPDGGVVRLNGIDIAEIDSTSLRRELAYLPQQHRLLEGTLLENMTRFRPDLHRAEALLLADELGLSTFLDVHHSGLATPVRRGMSLELPSAIVDRVSLIACLVGRPSVILFDESNMSLDADGDRRLRDYLAARKPDVALLVVSHRPSYLALCDRAVRLEGGSLHPEELFGAADPSFAASPPPLLLEGRL